MEKTNSKKTKVSLQEKIDVFTRYFEQGNEDLNGKTVFEGQPIGWWAIQIRSMLKRDDGSINPTAEQLEKLSSLGILDRQIDSTIDEKIDALIDWKAKHPDIVVSGEQETISQTTIEQLKELADRENISYDEILNRYEKLQGYREYVWHRAYEGKLTDEQRFKCKEGNLGGYFGFASDIEEVANKYNINPKLAYDIITQYGSIENAITMYRNGELSPSEVAYFNETIIDNLIDVDLNPNSKRYDTLIKAIVAGREPLNLTESQGDIHIYSSKKIDEMLSELQPREQAIIREYFGLDSGTHKTLEESGEIFGLTKDRANQIIAKGLRKMAVPDRKSKIKPMSFGELKNNPNITENEKESLTNIEEELWNSDYIFKDKAIEEKTDFDVSKLSYVSEIRDVLADKQEQLNSVENIHEGLVSGDVSPDTVDVGIMGLSFRTYHCLMRNGTVNLHELTNLTQQDLLGIRNLGQKGYEEIVAKLQEYGYMPNEEGKFVHTEQKVNEEKQVETEEKVYTTSELEEIRVKRDALEHQLAVLEEQTKQAKELLAEYDKIIDNGKTHTEDETPGFKDE